MTYGKIRRSKPCKRIRPPRLVHAVQRQVQPCVTANVMQITKMVVFLWALDISPPCVTRAAISVLAAARRVRGPDRRTSGKGGATSDGLVARRSGVTPGRSPRSTRRGVGGAARGSGRGAPAVILRAAPDGGVQVGSIVMAPSPPRYLHLGPAARARSLRPGGPARRPSPAPRRPESHRSPVPVAHRTFLPRLSLAISAKRALDITSSSCARHGSFSGRRVPGGTPSSHQFRSRMAHSFPVVGPRGRPAPATYDRSCSSGACGGRPRPGAGAHHRGRSGRRRRGVRGVRPSITTPGRCTVIDNRFRVRISCTAFLSGPPSLW